MRTVLIALGAIFLILIAAVGVFIGYMAVVGPALDASSKAYVDASVPAIISTWSKDELIKRSSPQLRKATTNGQVDQLFAEMKSLGAYETYDGAKGDSNINFTTKEGRVVTASYLATATFKNGRIDLQIKLIQIDGEWFLLRFYVSRHYGI
jgi:hypothetical protein